MGYGIAVSGIRSAEITSNILQFPTYFTGSQGINCTSHSYSLPPVPCVVDGSRPSDDTLVLQEEFQSIDNADSLTCVIPPDGGGWWDYSGRPHDTPQASITNDENADPDSSDTGPSSNE